MRTLKFGFAAAAAATALAGGAQAGVAYFDLDVNGCSTSCINPGITSIGTVTVTEQAGGKLKFDVSLGSPNLLHTGAPTEKVEFSVNGNSQHHAFTFKLDDNNATIGSVSAKFTGQAEGAYDEPPFTSGGKHAVTFNYAVDYTGSDKQGFSPSTLSFVVSDASKVGGLTLADLGFILTGGNDVYMAADVYGQTSATTGNTGNVGALGSGGPKVPEPATWAMLVLGVAGVGAAMRRRVSTAIA